MTERTTSARIEVHPSVLFRLGQDLITDEFQAVTELVKNSYDADATYAIVRIVTTHGPDGFPNDVGYVEVVDDGHGMTIDDIHHGWLTISNSLKGRMKAQGKTTSGGRTPLGDKGLGRLGAQRLGNRLTIVSTAPESDVTHELSFDWRIFIGEERLSNIIVSIRSLPAKRKPGTTITVSDLHNPERLTNVKDVEKELATVVSPYRGVMGFKLYGSVNGTPLDLEGLERRLRRAAVIHYDLVFDEDELSIAGRMRLNHLRPNAKKDRPVFDEICEADHGETLREFLETKPLAKDLQIRKASIDAWWIEFERTVRLSELEPFLVEAGGVVQDAVGEVAADVPCVGGEGDVASPGPFIGEIDGFNLSAGAAERVEGFASLRNLRKEIGDLAGIRIYRDGFNIRTDDDWIGLSRHWTSGSSWYGLRPGTTLGYIELSARDNAQLTETTDREGFNRTPHFKNFRKVMREFVSCSHEIQEFIGRSWVEFRRNRLAGSEGGTPKTPQELTGDLGRTLAEAGAHRTQLEHARVELAEAQETTGAITEEMITAAGVPEKARELLVPLSAAGRQAASAVDTIREIETYITELEALETAGERLQDELDSLEEQLVLGYETMGVGLVAESLAHEISNISDRLLLQANRIAKYVGREYPKDLHMMSFVEHIRGTASALRRQVAHLAPMLRYVREKREVIVLSELLGEITEYFITRWSGENMCVTLDVLCEGMARINRGKLLQVFDNLLLNSEYWLRQELRLGRLGQGRITIKLDGNQVYVSDNGRGIDPQIEHSLFEPFTTRKPSGRGLGLYICSRLLETDGCSIRLLMDRNHHGHRFVFGVDLSGAKAE